MRSIILIFTILTIGISSCTSTSKISNDLKLQERFLFKELIENGLYLGLSKADLLLQRPKAESNSDGFDFREIYVDTAFSRRFNTAIYYIDRDSLKPVYEFILLVDNGLDATKIATEKYGQPNHNEEWRFSAETTNLPFDIAVWTFKNKVIIAGTITGTEWEEGVE
jgi:hypothetical protein